MNQNKLSFGRKAGYGFGMLGESLALNTFLIYFMFFLTDAVGISPGTAGTIVIIAMIWGAFTDLFAGARSDGSKNPKGKRRPFIFKGAILLGIAVFLIYTDMPFIPMAVKPIYFTIVLLIFFAGLSIADMPYQSLGSEITEDYAERVQIRSYANIINYGGMILASSGSLALVSLLMSKGSSYAGAWSKVGLVFGILCLLGYWISVYATKGREKENIIDKSAENERLKDILKNYIDVIKLKAYRPVIVYSILVYAGMTFFTSMYIYYLSCNMGYDEGKCAWFGVVYSLFVIALSVIFGFIKIDAKKVIIASMFVWGAGLCVLHFVDMGTAGVYIIFFTFSVGMAAFFVQTYAVLYDVCDIDSYVSRKDRAGYILSLFYFISKVLAAVSIFAIGWILEGFGYDAALLQQSEETLNGISVGTLLISGILAILAGIAMFKYPGTNKRMNALRKAIGANQEDKSEIEEEFKELL